MGKIKSKRKLLKDGSYTTMNKELWSLGMGAIW